MKKTNIGIIGAGNMGSAIALGLTKIFEENQISLFDTDQKKLELLNSKKNFSQSKTIGELSKSCEIIIIAVKPHIVSKILTEIILKNQIIISIAAGVTIQSIESILGNDAKIIRVMPNTPALINQGMSVLSVNQNIVDNDVEIAKEIFSSIGKVEVLPENLMDAVTGLSGSGPAYLFTFLQAMIDGAVNQGIPRDKATLLAAQTIIGSTELVLQTGENPISLRGKVTSPGGTTIAAVHKLERAGFSGIVMDAIKEATEKSKELGK